MNGLKTCLTWLRNSISRTLPLIFLQIFINFPSNIFCKIFDSFQAIVKSFITADEDSGGPPEHQRVKNMYGVVTE